MNPVPRTTAAALVGDQVKVQQAAHRLLLKEGRPISSREIAKLVLGLNWVTSKSKDPVFSVASTIEKNIRTGTWNNPRLVFVKTAAGRQIGLPNWRPLDIAPGPTRRNVSVQIPEELAEQIHLATHARLAPSFEAAVALLLKKGLAAAAADIRAAMLKQLDALDRGA